jgi:hypothetical protein
MKRIKIILPAALFFVTASTIAQTKSKLKLPENKKYQVVNTLQSNSTTNIQGQSMESAVNVSSTYDIEVKGKSGSDYNLSSTISKLTTNMTMMGQEIKFDSENKEDMDGPFGSALKDFIGKPKAMKMDASGKVTFDEKDTAMSEIAKQLHLTQNAFGTQLAFLPLPEKAKVGATWTDKTDNEGISKTTNYTIQNITGNIATVSFESVDSVATSMEQNGMEISVKTSGKSSGEEKVDLKTGVIQSSTTKADATGTVSAMGQEFPMSTKITSTTTVTEL